MEVVEHLHKLLAAFDECCISSFNGSRLIIIGDWDLSYHHNFEAEFVEVSFVQCPTYFFAQGFHVATSQEHNQLELQINLADYASEQDHIYCFESDDYRFFIIAQSLIVREGLVLHHHALEPGEQSGEVGAD